jgi:hypothetical protein
MVLQSNTLAVLRALVGVPLILVVLASLQGVAYAVAYAEARNFSEAIKWEKKALESADSPRNMASKAREC